MKKRLFSALLALCIVLTALPLTGLTAFAAESGDFTYTVLSDGTAEITNYTGSATELTIPSQLDGYTVTSIGDIVFMYRDSLESITIPNSVTSIGYRAFYNCGGLTSITIPNSVMSIGDEAFYGCTSLTSATIGSGVTQMGDLVFSWCPALTNITVNSANPNYSSANGVLFNKDKTELIQYPIGKTETSYSIPNSVRSVGHNAFSSCALTSITIPNSVTSIGDEAFYNCDSLTSVTIPNSVTSIGDEAFSGCDSLTSVTIGNGVTSIGDYAFEYCDSLVSVSIGDNVTSIGRGAFISCDSLTNVTIPDSVTSIGGSAFSYCSSLANLTLGSGLKEIGDSAFAYCTALTEAFIPSGVENIAAGAFSGCDALTGITVAGSNSNYSSTDGVLYSKDKTKLVQYPAGKPVTSYTVPSGVTEIVYGSFANNNLLENVALPNSVTSIGQDAFSTCSALKSVTLGNGVTNIEENAFRYCESLASITIPDSVTSIGDSAFYGTAYYNNEDNWENNVLYIGNHCINARSDISGNYTIRTGTKTIADYAFAWCYSLTSVTIPNSVTSIGDSAFYGCDSLASITLPNSVTSIGDSAFYSCDSLTSATIPNNVTNIGDSAYGWCISLTGITVGSGNPNYSSANGVLFNKDKTELFQYPAGKTDKVYTIPSSVTSIGDDAFSGCDSLTSITIPNSVTSIGQDAFSTCSALKSVTLGNGVTNIEENAFRYCESLASITIPDSVTSIGDSAFYGTAYYNNEDNWENNVLYVGNHCIEANYNISDNYTIKTGTKTIADYAFAWCYSLTSVTIPDSVTSIGNSAFSGCALTSITIPGSVMNIGDRAFSSCGSLTSVTIPDSVTSIGDDAFAGCDNLTIYGYAGSAADTYALENDIPFYAIGTIEDEQTGVSVAGNGEDVLPEGTELSVVQTESTETQVSYNITLVQNGAAIQPAGAVTVMIPVPETMDGNACKVYRQEADGTYTDMNATYRDGYMVFTTDHFSVYVLTTDDPTATTFGDVNVDGKVDAVDARWVLQAAAGMRTLENATAADVNGDGKIDAVDARWILQAAAGMRMLGA